MKCQHATIFSTTSSSPSFYMSTISTSSFAQKKAEHERNKKNMLSEESFLLNIIHERYFCLSRSVIQLSRSYANFFSCVSLTFSSTRTILYIRKCCVIVLFLGSLYSQNSLPFICVCVVCSINFILMKMERRERKRKINVFGQQQSWSERSSTTSIAI